VVEAPDKLREEARLCRQIAREINDPAGIAMMRERAADLERRADKLDGFGDPPNAAPPTTSVVVALQPRRSARSEPRRRP